MKKVLSSINAITKELSESGGIEKTRKNAQQNYSFRGIDDVYNVLAPLLAKHKLVIYPAMTEKSRDQHETKAGGTLFYTHVKVDFHFVHAEDDSEIVVTVPGEAMDSGDKSSNKAMSAAMKYAFIQTFCIPTEGDNDPDAQTPEEVVPKKMKKAEPKKDEEGSYARAMQAIARATSKTELQEVIRRLENSLIKGTISDTEHRSLTDIANMKMDDLHV